MQDSISPKEKYGCRDLLLTETSNKKSKELDILNTSQLVELFSQEDLEPQKAVKKCLPQITNAIDNIIIAIIIQITRQIIY